MAVLMVKDTNVIQNAMALKGYSLKKLSAKVGVTAPYLSTVIRGKRTPSPVLAKKIAGALGLPIHEIFFTDNSCKS